MRRSEEVLEYWFGPSDDPAEVFAAQSQRWFRGGAAVDAEIEARFGDTMKAALAGELDGWLEAPRSCMAAVILLDQFTRNVFRGTPQAFSGDPQALAAAEHAIHAGYEAKLGVHHRSFLYIPFEHSERLAVQDRGVAHYVRLIEEDGPCLDRAKLFHDYAIQHRDIIARFGRFPHRNGILGRQSTAEEIEFLKEPGSSF